MGSVAAELSSSNMKKTLWETLSSFMEFKVFLILLAICQEGQLKKSNYF